MREILRDKWFWLIAGTALLLRVWHLWHAQQNPTFWAPAVDPLWYYQAAQRVADGDFGPWPLWRAPLYPWLLGAVYALVTNDLLWARLCNIVLQLGAVVSLYVAVARHFSPVAARIAAALLAVNGMAIFFSGEILSTSLELFLSVLAAAITLELRRTRTFRSAVVFGVVWGLAALTRPNYLLVAPVALFAACWPIRARVWRTAIAGLAVLLLTIAPITAANWIIGGEPVMIATQGGVNYWIGNNPAADGVSAILPGADRFWTMEQAAAIAHRETGEYLAPGALSVFYYDKGRAFQLAEPGHALQLMVRKALLFFNHFEASNNKHLTYFSAQTPGLLVLIQLNFALLLPIALLALWSARRSEARLLWVLVLAYAATVILFFIAARFRMPVVPWLCILAGVGGAGFVSLDSKPRRTALLAALLGFGIVVTNPFHAREPDEGSAHYMEGNAYLALGNLSAARTSFQTAQTDAGSRELAMLNLAVVEQRLGQADTARMILQALVTDYPQSARGWNNYGVALEQSGDSAAALAAYQHAMQSDAELRDARENYARLQLEEGKKHLRALEYQLALAPLSYSVNAWPSATAYYHLAVAYGRMGQDRQAQEQLDKALALDPNHLPSRQLKMGDFQSRADLPIPAPQPK